MPANNSISTPWTWGVEVARLPCPVCGLPPSKRHMPFCSRRCADIDLGRWFTEVYSVPSEEAPDEGDIPQDLPDAENE